MTTSNVGARVWGEDAPEWLAPSLALAGFASTFAVVLLVSQVESGPALVSDGAASPVTLAGASSSTNSPTSAASSTTSPQETSSASRETVCPPLAYGFESAAISLRPDARPAVDELGAWLVVHPSANVLLHGHADAYGKDDANLALSRMRANSISNQLVAAGVARSRITVRGFGSYQPVEGVPEEAASNRRVVVYVKDVSECPGASPGGMKR